MLKKGSHVYKSHYKAINEARIALLPEHVRKAITPAAIITQEVAG
jgi:hypothetical protein